MNIRGLSSSTATTITSCIFVALCEGFDLQAAGVAAGGLASEFRPTPYQLGTFFSASTFGLFIGALVGGRLSDSFGRKRVLLVALSLFGAFSLLTATASGITSASWARLLTGMGLGGVLPNLLALVRESSSATRRNANVALVYSGLPFGGALVSLLSLLTLSSRWRLIFIAGGAAPLILLPLLWKSLGESPFFSAANSPPDAKGQQAHQAPAVGSFVAIFTHGRGLPTTLLWASMFLALLTIYLLLSWLPILLVEHGFNRTEASAAQIAFNVGGGIAALIMGQVLEGSARRAAILVTFISGPVLVLSLGEASAQVGIVVAIVFALGCSMLAAQGFLYASAPGCYPTPIRGVGVGTAVAIGRLGSVIGPTLAGVLIGAGQSYSQLFIDILPLITLGSLAALMFARQTSRINYLE
jgi:MFS transporter, AAHS family, 3-hydroxyphenylpropionic acid transporter